MVCAISQAISYFVRVVGLNVPILQPKALPEKRVVTKDASKPVGTGVVAMARRSAPELDPFGITSQIEYQDDIYRGSSNSDLAKVSIIIWYTVI